MKKFGIVVAVVLVAASLIGCASDAKVADAKPADSNLPDYVLNPPTATDAIYGVGYAKQSSLPLAIKVAEANARADIAAQLKATIQAAVISYAQEAGVDDNTQVINFAESITRQITDTTLSGAVTQNRTPMEDGGVWVLMIYSKDSLVNSFEEVSKEFERNEDAAFAEFKADQALQKLDYQLANNPTTSNPVTE
ncbi:LPP20 family lipoprotein [Sediminispirochaeta bajacaliforniensis]|uniref:LPP20 family lipoprotein n=1 Tax=Sediminispirochaeta bajacaliforniensis TaxID=148 RepID=UPI00037BAB66|nr:LPP20 family lipoprotein [Sediminispirochaeta bajacaliforniensis]